MPNVCERLDEQLGALYECEDRGDHVRVRTPFMYPDGAYVELYFRDAQPNTLTDFGETLRWLDLQSASDTLTPKRRRLVQDVCTTEGVEFFKGTLTMRVEAEEDLAASVIRLGEAAVRVSDLWFTFRRRSVQTTKDEVEEFVEELEIPYERSAKFPGRSGRNWRVDFHARAPDRSSYVNVLTTGSRSSASRLTDHAVAMWHDLSHLKSAGQETVGFVSLFDDTVDVWREEDFAQVESLSDVAFWSDPDGFGELLTA